MSVSLRKFLTFALCGTTCLAHPHTERADTSRTSPPTGCLVVKQDTTTDGYYSSVGSAVSSLSGTASACVFIYSGTYNENITVEYEGPLTLYGYTEDVMTYEYNTVTIAFNMSSPVAGTLDLSSAVNARSGNFSMYNIDVKNTFGEGAQAVALTANGDRQSYYACGFFGYQDTVYAKTGDQYYSHCYFEGAVDYIFGKAAAWFEQCRIASNGGGAITANDRATDTDTSWYIFNNSTITAATGYNLTGDVYLGRPWDVEARVMYQYSDLSGIINAEGWTTMASNATPIFEEYENSGAGSSTVDRLYETVATAAVTKDQLWPSGSHWINSAY